MGTDGIKTGSAEAIRVGIARTASRENPRTSAKEALGRTEVMLL